jgi:heme/copper-type cytochrome/quinol oxidase subunit 2
MATIFIVVFALLAHDVIRFRSKSRDDRSEPAQVHGSTQVQLAWTVIPADRHRLVSRIGEGDRVDPEHSAAGVRPGGDCHRASYWWEYHYLASNIVTANEFNPPVSDPAHSTLTFLALLPANTDHSFWILRLGGKNDLIPNHPIKCRSTRMKQDCFSDRAHSIAARSMRRCRCASKVIRATSSSAWFASGSNWPTRARPLANAFSNRRRA